jgi:hypothetical protein
VPAEPFVTKVAVAACRAAARAFNSHVVVVAAAAGLGLAGTAAATVPPYTQVGTFAAPAGGSWDLLPDGRVIGLLGNTFSVESAPGAGDYTPIGSIDASLLPAFGASFVRVSPDGSRIGVGDNGANVLIVRTADLTTGGPAPVVPIAAPNYQGAWASNSTLFVSGFGASPLVSRIDADALTSGVVVDHVRDGSGGVVSDGTHLYVGVGFDGAPGGGDTGLVRAFDLSSLGGAPLDFGAGTPVADALSGDSLGFDALGNLLVGGGDFFAGSGDAGYGAVVDGDAIGAALAGGPLAPDDAELRLSPFGAGAFYAVRFNSFTGELLISDGTTIARYRVPAPAPVGTLAFGGALAARRRRRA